MKTKRCVFYLSAVILFTGIFQIKAADSTNTTTTIQESWEAISNRWSSVPIEKTRQTAEKGDVSAQYYLAIAYGGEIGVVTNQDEEAFKWMKLAAQQGMARAQRRLGSMFESGQGVKTNMSEACEWYQKAASQGDVWAQVNIGWHYEMGIGIEKNILKAFNWYQKAAQQGNSQGQLNLGNMYENGVGVPTNYVEAIKLFRLAAEQGHSMAQNNLGWLYANGFGVTQDFDEAFKWMQKSAAQGNTYAQGNLTWLASKAFNFEYQMAEKYYKGDGVSKDADEAFKWMKKAAESDYQSTKVNDALYKVGLMYESGEGVETNFSEAHNYISRAATGGQPDACYRVGQMYESGDGVRQDYYQATRNYYNAVANLNGRKFKSKAAENLLKLYAQGQGLSKTNQEPDDYLDGALADKEAVIQQFQGEITTSQAEFYVGQIYYQGKLVSPDLVEAAARFQVAADEGVDDARKMLVELEPKMSSDQKEMAKKQASNLKTNLNRQRSMQQALIQVYGW